MVFSCCTVGTGCSGGKSQYFGSKGLGKTKGFVKGSLDTIDASASKDETGKLNADDILDDCAEGTGCSEGKSQYFGSKGLGKTKRVLLDTIDGSAELLDDCARDNGYGDSGGLNEG